MCSESMHVRYRVGFHWNSGVFRCADNPRFLVATTGDVYVPFNPTYALKTGEACAPTTGSQRSNSHFNGGDI